MDIEYISDLVGKRVRDFVLYDKDGNYNSEKETARRYDLIRYKLRGTVGLDELEIADEGNPPIRNTWAEPPMGQG